MNTGNSVCTGCGKDMPRVWDVVCYRCDDARCYGCARAKDGFWFCKPKCKEKAA